MVVVRAVDEERRADGERDRLARLFDELDNLDVVLVNGESSAGTSLVGCSHLLRLI